MSDTYADLRALAEAATPGPWSPLLHDVETPNPTAWWMAYPDPESDRFDWPQITADAAFLTAANPTRILALLADLDALAAKVEAVQRVVDDPRATGGPMYDGFVTVRDVRRALAPGGGR